MNSSSFFRHFHPIWQISLLGFVCFQFFFWQGYAPDVAWLTIKRLSPWSLPKDDLAMGGICNALKKYNCSRDAFKNAVSTDPENKIALGNLGIVLTKLGQDDEALKIFPEYFRLGGGAVDVMHSYAESLAAKGSFDKSLYWLYRAAALRTMSTEVTNSLIDQLMLMNRLEEALSVLAGVTSGLPEREVFWKTKFESLKHAWVSKWSEPIKGKVKIRIPAIAQKKFYLPIIVGEENKIEFVLVNYEHEESQLDARLLKNNFSDSKNIVREPSSHQLRNTISIGSWKIQDVPVKSCNDCDSYLGRSFLDLLQYNYYREDQIEFLELTKPE